ncbi:MAG: hypothetical protein PQJ60_13025 [Spirochaetales bacterium]|nr:hypothetical protein [Spirochaetales bacterium]
MIYASLKNKTLVYTDGTGISVQPKPKGKGTVCLDLNLCPLVSLDLPPLKKHDRDLLIEKNLPSHFPESLESWEWDSYSHGAETLVFLIRKSFLKTLREDWGKDVRLISPAFSLPKSPEKGIFQFNGSGGYDLFFYGEGRLDHALHLTEREDVSALTREFLGDSASPVKFTLESGKIGLFREKKKRGNPLLLLLLLPLIPLTYSGILMRNNRVVEQKLRLLEEERKEYMIKEAGREEEIPWQEIKVVLEENQPASLYRRLEILYPFFYGEAVILNISLSKENFQIQAQGKNPLNILDALRMVPEIDRVTLYQSREQESLEIFNISGRWK